MKKAFKEIIKWIVRGAIYIWCKIYYRAEIIGLENIPKDEPLIFCGNHRNYLDPPLIVATAKRDIKFLAKEELYKNKFLAALGCVFEAIPVKRDEKDISAIKTSLKDLKEGKKINVNNYIEKEKNYNNKVSTYTLKLSNLIDKCINKSLRLVLKYLENSNI